MPDESVSSFKRIALRNAQKRLRDAPFAARGADGCGPGHAVAQKHMSEMHCARTRGRRSSVLGKAGWRTDVELVEQEKRVQIRHVVAADAAADACADALALG